MTALFVYVPFETPKGREFPAFQRLNFIMAFPGHPITRRGKGSNRTVSHPAYNLPVCQAKSGLKIICMTE
jgi:hypothetical protein